MMQLDLLGKEAVPVPPETNTVSVKKTRTPPLRTPAKPMTHATPATDESSEEKAPSAFRTISEAADMLGVPQHVLRFWEGRFSQIKPLKLRGGRRYYRPEDMEILTTIKNLLYKQGYTIKGAKKAFSSRKLEVTSEPVEAAVPTVTRTLTDKQQSQLSVIKQELIGLQDILKPHVF